MRATDGTAGGRLLLVGLGVMGAPYLRAAQRRYREVVVLDTELSMRYSGLADLVRPEDRVVTVPATADEHWFQAAAGIRDDIDAVHAFSEPHVLPAALIAAQLGLPGPGLHAAVVSRNKAYQRALFARHGVPQPEHTVLDDPDQARAWAADRYPVVGKPVGESGSTGVRVLSRSADLDEWLATMRGQRAFLLEEFVDAPEYSVEALVCDGEVVFTNVTRKHVTEPPYCVELEHHAPATLAPDAEKQMTDVLRAAVRAMHCRYCLVHLELRSAGDGPRVLEVAVRTPGDHLMEVVGLAHGIDLFDAALALSAGRAPTLPAAPPRAAASWFPVAEPGRITAIGGTEEIRDQPGTELLRVYASPGTVARPVRSSADRLGAVVVSGADGEECTRRLENVKRLLRVETEPEEDSLVPARS